MSIFQKKASSNDIAEEMEKSLMDSAQSDIAEAQRQMEVIRSLDAIATLAEKYENEGLVHEAELLTKLLEAYATGDSEALKHNLLETGTLFEKKDFAAAEDGEDLQIDEEDEKVVQGLLSSFDDEE